MTSLKTCSTCAREYDAEFDHCPHCDEDAAARARKAAPAAHVRAAIRRWFPVVPAAIALVASIAVPTIHATFPGRTFSPAVTLWEASASTWKWLLDGNVSAKLIDYLLAGAPVITLASLLIIVLTVLARRARKPYLAVLTSLISLGAFAWLNMLVRQTNEYLYVTRLEYPVGGMLIGFPLLVLAFVGAYCLWPRTRA